MDRLIASSRRRQIIFPSCCILLVGGACAELPVQELDAAKVKVEAARQADAENYSPEAFEVSERTLMRAQRESARQMRRFIWFRTYDRAKRLASKAGSRAVLARVSAVQNKTRAREVAFETLEKTKAVIDRTLSILGRVPLDRGGNREVGAARVALEEAEHLLKDEKFEAVQNLLDRTIAELDRVRSGVELRIRDYARHQERWGRWVDETLKWSSLHSAHAVVVDKVNRRAELYYGGVLRKRFQVDIGMRWLGKKLHRGDNATPEGKYKIVRKIAEARYNRGLLLDYPNEEDKRRFKMLKQRGRIPRSVDIGGSITIHGSGGRGKDWTEGCVALTDIDIETLFGHVRVGTPVTIVGCNPRS